jgi:two-component system cell cycle sensor histidine kinase/response regulator CckA
VLAECPWIADLVITDVMMPGIDGFQLARKVRSELATHHIPVVFYTADYLAQARGIDALDVRRIVPKDGNLTELVDAVNEILTAVA